MVGARAGVGRLAPGQNDLHLLRVCAGLFLTNAALLLLRARCRGAGAWHDR